MHDWFYQYYCGAGRSAHTKYREVSGRWQKRIFRRPRLISVGLAGLIVVVAALERPNVWLWGLDLFLTIVLAVYIVILESPPGYIENWRTGFEGERRTARVLAPLRRHGYVLLHDLPDRRTRGRHDKSNIDHIVVSTGGVFLLDSKCLGGEVSIDRDTVHVQRLDDDDASYELTKLTRGMRGRAFRLREDILQQTGVGFVQPVVVFWNRFEAKQVMSEKVVFVHGDCLVGWLQEQRSTMDVGTVASVASCIRNVRPSEHSAWWDRRPTFGLRRRNAAAISPPAGGVVSKL